MELDFDKYCVVDGSPTTVLPAPRRRTKVANRKSNGKPECGNDILSINEEFTEIKFNRYHSASCRDVGSRRANPDGNEVLKRGSVYQSSKEVRLLKKTVAVAERKKIEFPHGNASTFFFGIVDSLCSSDEDTLLVEQNRSSVMSLSEHSTSSACKHHREVNAQDFKKCSFHPVPQRFCPPNVYFSEYDERETQSANNSDNCLQHLMITSESFIDPINHGNIPKQRDLAVNLHKSLSAKLALPHSPVQSDSDSSKAGSQKAQYYHVRKMFDPFVKSKSQRSPLSYGSNTNYETVGGFGGINSNKTTFKSQLNDLSDRPRHVKHNYQCEKKENHNLVQPCSPAHLHGLFRLENKNRVPYFEFTVKSPEEVYIAKTWKMEDALTWVYTFHSLHLRRKSNANGQGSKDSNRESSVTGQMHVSCHLCTNVKDAGALHDSILTEFVLYDIAHSRKSISSQNNSSCSSDVVKAPLGSDEILTWGNCELNKVSAKNKNKGPLKNSRESSSSQPLTAAELHPELESAAIVMQVPLEKRESLKFKNEDKYIDMPPPNLLDLCQLEQAKEGISVNSCPWKMHVVIPDGNHSLPSMEGGDPSSILDRWRLGGGCDCGGWDMSCPLNIYGNANIQIAEGHPLAKENQHPVELFAQGRKDNVPAFTMREIEDGKYAVDFHAQFSSLQAFSICVAILHAAEDTTTAVVQERRNQMLHVDLMRAFAKEEIKQLIDEKSEEEKFKVNKKTGEVLPYFVLDPPLSPIARV